MDALEKYKIDNLIRKNLTNDICLSGSNISNMSHMLKRKYVSKKEMRKALLNQYEYLLKIQDTKNALLKLLIPNEKSV